MNKQSYEEGIASIIKNYRRLELKKPLDLQHVQRWIQQFEPEEQEIVLKETFHALTRYYINEEKIYNFIDQVLESITKEERIDNIIFANVQKKGHSQKLIYEYIKSKGEFLFERENFEDVSKLYIYIDDGLYSGKRAKEDIGKLVGSLQSGARLNVYYMIAYSNGFNYWSHKIYEQAKERNVTVQFICEKEYLNNREKGFEKYEFLWPDKNCADEIEIVDFEKKLRETEKVCCPYCYMEDNTGVCSSPENNKKLTKIFLKYGIKIANRVAKNRFLPLGFAYPVSFGFGAFSVNEWNIANNCPLVLWWGDINDPEHFPGSWYPLFPRRDNGTFYEEICQREETFLLESNKEILRTVYKLSVDEYRKERNSRKTWSELIRNMDVHELYEERQKSELYQYMNSLDMNAIKMIQTIMYIGREYHSENSEYYYDGFNEEDFEQKEEKLPVSNPDFLFMVWLEDLSNEKGWEEKDVEINQIYSKHLVLHEYFKRAFKILGISTQ